MIDRFKAMREKLEEHGKIKPDDELSNKEIQKMYMKYQFEFMRAAAKKSKPPKKKKKAAPAKTDQLPKSKEIKKPCHQSAPLLMISFLHFRQHKFRHLL